MNEGEKFLVDDCPRSIHFDRSTASSKFAELLQGGTAALYNPQVYFPVYLNDMYRSLFKKHSM